MQISGHRSLVPAETYQTRYYSLLADARGVIVNALNFDSRRRNNNDDHAVSHHCYIPIPEENVR